MKGIRECLDGKDVLVTGGSGFMGKVLLERLLRSTNVNKIYVIIRPKRGLSPQARINEMTKLPAFDLIRKSCPERLKNIIPVEGDLSAENLGLSQATISNLENTVSIVFNFAASLKLEDPLKTLVTINTVGTLRLLEVACRFKKLMAFVHLSTAFCHCEEDVLEERLYEPPANPRDVIDAMSWMDEEMADKITPHEDHHHWLYLPCLGEYFRCDHHQDSGLWLEDDAVAVKVFTEDKEAAANCDGHRLLGPHPNCYTYTKRLAEGLMKEFGPKIPVAIVRPSIVTPAMQEPCKGWVDSLNGPMGVLVAGAKGVLRSMLCSKENRAEVVPVDIAINGVLLAAWKRCKTEIGDGEVLVFNLSAGEVDPITWGDVLELGKSTLKQYPLDCGLWYPGGTIRTNPYTHALIVFLCQVVPAYFIDFLFFLARQKRFMVRVQNRIRLGSKLLQYFTMRQWCFKINYFVNTFNELPEEEKQIFYGTNAKYTLETYMKDCILGARVFCMKEPLSDLPKARKQLIMMWWIDKTAQVMLFGFVGWLLYTYIPMIKMFSDSIIATARTHTKEISVA